MKKNLICVFFLFFLSPAVYSQPIGEVKIWKDTLTLPTYLTHKPDLNPMFFRNQSYQGASRVIYPYPLMDNLSNIKQDKIYTALYLENRYIKLCVLPEIGGKLFYATDKTNDYEIFYRQHVIKPSNIGMLGAWISGGIEWCVFHHHRASTFLTVDYTLSENKDGSKTIWVGEIEPRHRMKWTIGITLYPDKSFIEVNVKLFNRTENVNSFLYWANVATHANKDYQVIFPPGIEYATFHAKNSFSHWPVTREEYRGNDYYKNNIDASWWKNHPDPVSFFAYDLKDGFLAGYDHGKNAGTMHVANPHIATGAKLWEWGPGQRGSMWDTKVLTDNDGPYAELMTGAYSDNQPDYSWIKPYEYKQVKQYWYPLCETRGVKNANKQATVNLQLISPDTVFVAFNTTGEYNNAKVTLVTRNNKFFTEIINIAPDNPFIKNIKLPENTSETDIKVTLYTAENEELISYKPDDKEYNPDLPPEVKQPLSPDEIETNEELFLTGLRIKQFHNARLNALDYFREALRRDPNDMRCNIQLGIDYKQRAMYEEAKIHFRIAINRLTKDYTRPQNCEALYHLGLVLQTQGKYKSAYDTLYRATWDYAYYAAAHYNLAQIASIKKNFAVALEHINRSLTTNNKNTKVLNLKSAILRKLGKYEKAGKITEEVLDIDVLDHWVRNERYLINNHTNRQKEADKELAELTSIMRNYPDYYLELAIDYMNCGFTEEAFEVLERAINSNNEQLGNYPLIHYYLGYLNLKQDRKDIAETFFSKARKLPTDYCFPYRSETIKVLNEVIRNDKTDSRAYYYLGNILYDKQPGKAMKNWKKAVGLEKSLAIAHRNLGWGYFYHEKNISKAIDAYETAVKYNPSQPKYYYELDLLYERNNTPIEKRLSVLTDNHKHVALREDALAREILVLVLNKKYDKAIEYLENNFFHIQEGTHALHDIYVDAHLLRGISFQKKQDYKPALDNLLKADIYPENHQIGRNIKYARNPQIYYYTGLAYEKAGDLQKAVEYFEKSVSSDKKESQYMYFQAMAYKKLNDISSADKLFEDLIRLGEKKLVQLDEIDFFSKFGEGESKQKRQASAYFIKGLGYLGKGLKKQAGELFQKVIQLDTGHIWAKEFYEEILIDLTN